MVESTNLVVSDFKGFRTVNIAGSCSMLNNNLCSRDGTYFAFLKNTNSGGQIHLYDDHLTSKEEDFVDKKAQIEGHKSDGMHIKYHKVNNTWYLIVCHMAVCLIFNFNGTRRLFTFEVNKASSSKMQMSG